MSPALDVSDLLLDPDFCEPLNVFRRPVTMTKGRAVTGTPVLLQPQPWGVVTTEGLDLLRVEDEQNLPTTIVVHTQYRLRGPAPGFAPDILSWNGDNYVVSKIDNYSHFGGGFVAATCTSMDSQDNPPALPFTLDKSNLDGPDTLT